MELDPGAGPAKTEVHRCRFVEYQPDGINCIEPQQRTEGGPAVDERVAVARSNGNVEIWNVSSGWHMERQIPGGEELSVETLVWAGDRLFTAGLHSMITEWSTVTLAVETIVDSFGGSVWCMALSNDGAFLAAGCEDGSVKLLDTSGGALEYARSFDKQEGRILSVDWDQDGQSLVSGGSDATIRVWNATTGKCRLRILVQSERNDPALVWSVKMLPDKSIVSGDSFGKTQIWDGKFGTLLQSFKQHEADVLVTLVSPDAQTIFASGVDNKVIQLKKIAADEEGGHDSWILAGRAREHTHDVRALALASNDVLVSGGVDSNMIVYPASTFGQAGTSHRKIPPFPQHNVITLAPAAGRLLYQYNRTIKIWQLGASDSDPDDPADPAIEGFGPSAAAGYVPVGKLPVSTAPQLLVEMRTNTADNIIASSISADGARMAYSSMGGTRVFRIKTSEDGTCAIARLKGLSSDLRVAHTMAFTKDGSMLVLATTDEHLQIVDTRTPELIATIKVPMPKTEQRNGCLLAISTDGVWIAVAYSARFHIYNMDTMQHCGSTPLFAAVPSAAAFLPGSAKMVVTCVDNQISIYNVAKNVQTEWSKNHSDALPLQWMHKKEKTVSIVFDPSKTTTAFLHDHAGIYVVDFAKQLPKRSAGLFQIGGPQKRGGAQKLKDSQRAQKLKKDARKGKKRENGKKGKAKFTPPASTSTEDDVKASNFKLIKRYQPLLFLGFAESEKLVVVERPWLSVMQNLPPPLFRQKYGV